MQRHAVARLPVQDQLGDAALDVADEHAAEPEHQQRAELGIPGHAGVGWIAVLVAGRLGNPRAGMATVAGLSMEACGVPVGLNHSLAYNSVLYGMAGVILDSGAMLRIPLQRWWGATIAGVLTTIANG